MNVDVIEILYYNEGDEDVTHQPDNVLPIADVLHP